MTQTSRTGTCTKAAIAAPDKSAIAAPDKSTFKGFTLLELVIVLFIISLFFMVAVPSFSRRESCSGEALQMASLLRELNDSAQTMKKSFSITFDMDGHEIKWSGPDGEKSMALNSLAWVNLPSKGDVKQGTLKFFFDTGGALEDLNVHLRGENDAFLVYLNEMSGRVKVIEE